MTLLDIEADIADSSKIRSLLSDTEFKLPPKDSDNYGEVGVLSTHMLKKDRSLSWEQEASLLSIHTQFRGEYEVMLPTLMHLLKTATEIRSGEFSRGEISFGEKVTKLTELAEQISESFDYKRNSYRNSSNPAVRGWLSFVPACDEAQKLFYAGIAKLNLPNDYPLPYADTNHYAYYHALEEIKAQNLLDELDKNPKRNLNQDEWDQLVKHRPQQLLNVKNLSLDNRFKLLQHSGLKISEVKRLEMMTQFIKDLEQDKNAVIKLEHINYFLDSALKMKTVNPAMKKFIAAATPITERYQERYQSQKEQIARYEQNRELSRNAQAELQRHDNAFKALANLQNIYRDINDLKSEKEKSLSLEAVGEIVSNAANKNKPDRVDYAVQTGVSALFTGKKEKQRQQDMAKCIKELNVTLSELPQYKDIFSQIDAGLLTMEAFHQCMTLRSISQDKLTEAQDEFRQTPKYQNADNQQNVAHYERNNPAAKLSQLTETFVGKTKELRLKARESLSFAFKGQEFDGESVFAEQEKAVQKVSKKKVAELQQKLKGAVVEEMTDRGVYEKPEAEANGKPAKKLSKESADKVLNMMRDKKLYAKMAKGK